MSTATIASRSARAAQALLLSLARAAHRARTAAPRAVRWFLDHPERLLTVAWLGGLLIVGSAARAGAQDDIIIGPDLADGNAQTLFEAFSMWDYRLLVKPDEEASGWFDIGAGLWHGLGILNYILLWIVLGLLYGGLTLLAWFLNLTVYRDSAMEIDGAVQMVADHVFWPLIPATVAVGGLIAYARWRGDGRGFVGDLGWVVAATAMAIAFASGPSAIMGQLDQARQTTATAVISGASDYINTSGNPVGYSTPEVGGPPQDAATRTLTDGLWSTFGATPWCYAQFRELDICREAGTHALADDDVWQGWMAELDAGRTPAVFGEQGDYVRGQDITRTGVLLLMAVVSLPLAWMLVRLVMSGLVAVVGFLLMLVLGLLFLTFWPIEGFLRRVGTQYWIYTLGMLLQALFITVAVSGVMVVSTVIASLAGQFGFFLVAVLNVALFAAATKARSWLDMLTTVGGASSGGMATALIARSVARTVVRTVAGAASGGTAAAASAVGAAAGAGRGRSWTQGKGVHPSSLPNAGGGKGGQNGGQGTGLDNGPLKAQSTRMRQHGSEPQLNATGTALPAGTGGSTLTPAGNNATAASTAAGGRRVPPMPGQSPGTDSTGSSRRAVSPTDITTRPDQTAARNVAAEQRRTGGRGRVWVAPPGGSETAPLDSPRPARTRGNTPRITNARNGTWE